MTRKDIIRMALEAGATKWCPGWHVWTDELERFAALVAAAEREALLETVYSYARSLSWNEDFQADVRARGNT